MSVYSSNHRLSSHAAMAASNLEDRFEVVKDIGDGSFGSVALARVRTAGVASLNVKRNTMVAIKTMKKSFESFAPCLELREVIFLRSLPVHAHLVPALDIFLDPTTKKLHIAMEYMDGNLYQLMKSRDHRIMDISSVKSILYQILSGMDHIHTNNFFHRDIKPENILISTSAPQDSSSALSFRRYSSMVTPPSTPPAYSVKIADFGLAREIDSKSPYTTYVSTRWYRAPEVLLRAGEYSAPVDMWAFGAMAVEVATLKPLFPGGNEVDQVWRVCEIMGSPGNWYNKAEVKIGGGEWKDGKRLAQKLGFSFPKMAPHAMETILQPPTWPQTFANFVTWCLMWDPKNRPTSFQAMQHEFFTDAVDPLLRPKSRLLGRKHSNFEQRNRDSAEIPQLTGRSSWFRKSLIGRDSAPVIPQHISSPQPIQPQPSPIAASQLPPYPSANVGKARPAANKRATWQGPTPSVGAPMPILPSIRPVSPLSNAVTAEARTTHQDDHVNTTEDASLAQTTTTPAGLTSTVAQPEKAKKIGRQLSLASHGNHYADLPAHDSRTHSGVTSPTNGQKEGFFSHLRKRARRLSGRNQLPVSPRYEDVEANAGCGPWASARSSMALDPTQSVADIANKSDYAELDKALQNVRYSLDAASQNSGPGIAPAPKVAFPSSVPVPAGIKRSTSASHIQINRMSTDEAIVAPPGPISSRTRRALHLSTHPAHRYETPDEEEELLDEALRGVKQAVAQPTHVYTNANDFLINKDANAHRQPLGHRLSVDAISNPYPTPSPSAKRNGMFFNNSLLPEPATPMNVARTQRKDPNSSTWPTPPYEGNDWVSSATANAYAPSGITYR